MVSIAVQCWCSTGAVLSSTEHSDCNECCRQRRVPRLTWTTLGLKSPHASPPIHSNCGIGLLRRAFVFLLAWSVMAVKSRSLTFFWAWLLLRSAAAIPSIMASKTIEYLIVNKRNEKKANVVTRRAWAFILGLYGEKRGGAILDHDRVQFTSHKNSLL